jgi:hypothetical protein
MGVAEVARPCLYPQIGTAAKRRQHVAHGVSRGLVASYKRRAAKRRQQSSPCYRRFAARHRPYHHDLRANARSYVRMSLRDYENLGKDTAPDFGRSRKTELLPVRLPW